MMRRTSGRTHEQQHHKAEQRHDDELDAAHDVVLGELQAASQPVGSRSGCCGVSAKRRFDHLDLVAALLVEADRGAHQRGDAVDLFLAARLVADLALVVLA